MARSRAKPPTDWVALTRVTLPTLQPAGRDDLRAGEAHDALAFYDLVDVGVRADGAAFLDCRFTGCRLLDSRLRRARFVGCLLQDVQATALDAGDSTWRDVVVRASRLGALLAPGANLTRVMVAESRLDYVNLRGATLAQVQLLDCRIGELDVGAARLDEVRLPGCVVDKLVLSGATLAAVELQGVELAALDGVDCLAGASISPTQLTQLAPALAAHLGIRVAAD